MEVFGFLKSLVGNKLLTISRHLVIIANIMTILSQQNHFLYHNKKNPQCSNSVHVSLMK